MIVGRWGDRSLPGDTLGYPGRSNRATRHLALVLGFCRNHHRAAGDSWQRRLTAFRDVELLHHPRELDGRFGPSRHALTRGDWPAALCRLGARDLYKDHRVDACWRQAAWQQSIDITGAGNVG